MLLNKTDLLAYLQFDVDQRIAYAQRVNPDITILQVSATTGEDMQLCYKRLREQHQSIHFDEKTQSTITVNN